ncbi:DUF1206 domain-containing protein [Pelagovum pacificum]|uniref:DUF1206 domain-containing protein n=1 Tax=Pelagovum pacificum TaxID=2588711 RepID=A0A5C5GC86_9RHOB|nr:DUF1206 domain-containing protein [Pelagovum pacificum]QQA44533.1 DUF1206 domain-containing protein [Pelagovum pacificum]TNY32353.1 DUF1206 domain-containing protein [Pelagovum pacificum]
MSDTDLSWAKPVMRIGYAGRGLVYLAVGGFSLFSIWRGGDAEGTNSALQTLETTPGGNILLVLIGAGLIAYMVWRIVDCIWDLEDYGTEAKGIVARIGMLVTGVIHGALGVLALSIIFASGGAGGGEGSFTGRMLEQIMSAPGGRWAVGIAGLVILGAGLYYLHKAWSEKYREELRANSFTMKWNPALKAGVAAQGVSIAIIGGLVISAALHADGSEAGGMGTAFDWLGEQVYGQILVTLLCIGLLGFALFCFTNAAYRIIPKIADDGVESLGRRLKAKAEAAAA